LIPYRDPQLLQQCEMFLIRHRSRHLRLVIGIEANLPYSVVRQKSDTTLLSSCLQRCLCHAQWLFAPYLRPAS
jgi:hypothetical protein